MKLLQIVFVLGIVALSKCELQISRRPLVFPGWPPKSAKQTGIGVRNPVGAKRTLVLQIRSDKHVPIVLKRPPQQQAQRGVGRPHKVIIKPGQLHSNKLIGRKPSNVLKIKLPNVTPSHFEKPYHYEQPYQLVSEVQQLPLEENTHFVSEHFAPIHTIPAPNLSIQDNHLFQPDNQYLPPEPQPYHSNHYQVNEDQTNDQTGLDPFSGKQKLFAPDPDPSLPAATIRPATEPYNTPSNGKPLPADIQSNFLPPAQALTQLVSPSHQQAQLPELIGLQYVGQPIQLAPIAIQNPTYLVTQSNHLFNQHQQELFRPNDNIITSSYVDADLTQEVASNGQILQAAKDPANNIHPQYTAADVAISAAPQFAALIAAPPASTAHAVHIEQRAPFQLANVAVPQQNGFVASEYFGSAHGDSQLLQAFAEEESQREQAHGEHQAHLEYEHRLHQEQQEQQALLQQQHNHQLELQQHHEQQQHHQQQQLQQQQQYELQQNQHHHQQLLAQPQPSSDPATAAFEEHKRLVEKQLGPQSLRIFVPDESENGFTSDGRQKLKKRSNERKVKKSKDKVSSVEVSSEDQKP
ncbi:mastermind-like domain-containing protein 1 [Eupeodes corollae]|uniref:mastermind-like domain-containing protein 1 n=1 Tax=Eupeodes corollae TaxID=290404 RepID=UPI0024925B01|nr:mastermind-like domain-containing protein 1 [Eupeodes corollae]XP_055903845.1 mastermind-like domain-containing protein 1 [Eupeodes corollae]